MLKLNIYETNSFPGDYGYGVLAAYCQMLIDKNEEKDLDELLFEQQKRSAENVKRIITSSSVRQAVAVIKGEKSIGRTY
jgi:hypothetical protein